MRKPIRTADQLATKSVVELIALQERIEAILRSRIEREKVAVLERLETIRRFEKRKTTSEVSLKSVRPLPNRARPRKKPSPKYRDPDSGNTWTGRGVLPKWLRQAVQEGRKLEEFLISHPSAVHD